MSELTAEQIASHDASLQRALDEPMPRDLRESIAGLIEPHTLNMYLDHGDTMDCIDVAFPVIRDYLREHPELYPPAGYRSPARPYPTRHRQLSLERRAFIPSPGAFPLDVRPPELQLTAAVGVPRELTPQARGALLLPQRPPGHATAPSGARFRNTTGCPSPATNAIQLESYFWYTCFMPGDRKCSTCLEVKSADQFEKKGNQCRECIRARARKRYAEDPEKYRAKNRARYRRNSARSRQRHPWGYRRPGSETYLCTRCGLVKAADCFEMAYTGRSLRSHCRECRVEDSRWGAVARKYGLSKSQYAELLASQGGNCAICKKPPSAARQLAVDHDHRCCPGDMTCGKCIRGLLCTDCNHLLGQAGDDPEILRSAAAYLGPARTGDDIAAHPTTMLQALQHCA